MLKIAVLAPMPSASVTSAAIVKPGGATQHADAVAGVLQVRLQRRQRPLVGVGFRHLLTTAKSRPRLAAGVLGFHPLPPQLLLLHLEVELKLVVQIAAIAIRAR